jgi:hypothetical protein
VRMFFEFRDEEGKRNPKNPTDNSGSYTLCVCVYEIDSCCVRSFVFVVVCVFVVVVCDVCVCVINM